MNDVKLQIKSREQDTYVVTMIKLFVKIKMYGRKFLL